MCQTLPLDTGPCSDQVRSLYQGTGLRKGGIAVLLSNEPKHDTCWSRCVGKGGRSGQYWESEADHVTGNVMNVTIVR